MSMPDHPHIHLDISAPFAEIIIDRPEAKNALTIEMWYALKTAFVAAEGADDAKIILLHGGDTGSFAAGADIAEFESFDQKPENIGRFADAINGTIEAIAACPKPVFAMIRGASVGGGCALALACDLRFADETAYFAAAPARMGLVYSQGDIRRLIAAVGSGRARDLLFSARRVNANEALKMGLIQYTAVASELDETCRKFGVKVASNSQASIAQLKTLIRASELGEDFTGAQTEAMFLELFDGPDFAEARRAFSEKRAPRFPSAYKPKPD